MGSQLLAFLCGVLAFAAASAQPAQDIAAREQARARIEAERTRIEAQFDADLVACQQRFVVTACVDEARQRRRDALAQPRAEGLALDDIERRERAAARREAVQAKQREAAARTAPASSAAPASPISPAGRASEPQLRVTPPPQAAPSASAPRHRRSPAAASSAAAADARQRSLAARERQAEIEATQARIRARQAERLREGKVAAPLPVPAASR